MIITYQLFAISFIIKYSLNTKEKENWDLVDFISNFYFEIDQPSSVLLTCVPKALFKHTILSKSFLNVKGFNFQCTNYTNFHKKLPLLIEKKKSYILSFLRENSYILFKF